MTIEHRAITVGAEPVALAEGGEGGVTWEMESLGSGAISVGGPNVGTDGPNRGWLVPARKQVKFTLGPDDVLYGVGDSPAVVIVFRADATPNVST